MTSGPPPNPPPPASIPPDSDSDGFLTPRPYTARSMWVELIIVFLVTLASSGLSSLVSLIDSLLAPVPLASQTVAIVVPQAQASFLDLIKQLLSIVRGFAWGALGLYLLWRSGVNLRDRLGLDLRRPWSDLGTGVVLAAVIGIPGIWRSTCRRSQIGINLTVAPTTLNDVWWRLPVLILAAIENGFLEEVLVVGYLMTRLDQLKVPAVVGDRHQRGAARLVPPVPGVRRVPRQRGHGRGVRLVVPPHPAAVAAGDRALAAGHHRRSSATRLLKASVSWLP